MPPSPVLPVLLAMASLSPAEASTPLDLADTQTGTSLAQAARPTLSQIVLQIASTRSPDGILLNFESIERQVKDWFDHAGIKVVDRSAASEKTYLVLLDLFTSKSPDGIHLCGVRQTCAPLNQTIERENKVTSERPSWSTIRLAGQQGEEDFNQTAGRAILGILADINGEIESRQAPERTFPRLVHHGSWWDDGKRDRVTDFNFSEMKIRRQPPAPAYPQAALKEGVQGTVIVEITVDPTGKPLRAIALSGPQALMVAALRYALAWEFEPATINGQARSARFKLTMPFKLK